MQGSLLSLLYITEIVLYLLNSLSPILKHLSNSPSSPVLNSILSKDKWKVFYTLRGIILQIILRIHVHCSSLTSGMCRVKSELMGIKLGSEGDGQFDIIQYSAWSVCRGAERWSDELLLAAGSAAEPGLSASNWLTHRWRWDWSPVVCRLSHWAQQHGHTENREPETDTQWSIETVKHGVRSGKIISFLPERC